MDFSAASLFASLVVSSVGLGFFIYGKKQLRTPQLIVGLAMMVFPYFVPDPLAMCGMGAGLLAGMFVALRAGM